MEWKASRRYTSPFPELRIAPADAAELEALAHVFVAESIRNYERFLFSEHSVVDESRWKFMYEQENVRSYAERKSAGARGPNASVTGDDDVPMHADTPVPEMPIILVTGDIQGDLDDTMYGYVCPTLDMLRIKTAYIKDGVYRACVLASLVNPTEDDPFRSVTIKWIERRQPFHVRAVIKNRDYLYMESNGIEYLRNGERVGYQLLHSVQFPGTPELGTSIRGNMSMSAIYRQKDHQTVEVFLKGFLNPAGGLMRSIVTRAAAKGLVTISQHVQCAQLKKLAWAVRQHRNARRAASDGESSRSNSSARSALSDGKANAEMVCSSCARKKSAAKKMLPGGKSMKHRTCRLCSKYVCKRCRIEKKLFFMLADRRLVQQTVRFCAGCLHQALSTKTMTVVRHEVVFNAEMYGWSEPSVGSSGTELSFVEDLNV